MMIMEQDKTEAKMDKEYTKKDIVKGMGFWMLAAFSLGFFSMLYVLLFWIAS